ncbi:Arylsulfatase A [Auraticoccus monumenti]|uniref:Arylsulfatase A n=1 Tax=Auraticoccus monumenti TaxID=675864 RepID=A0A1G6Z9M8_9ACTN|nr:Arylsulfatase A [Auraticoccus monumenti]
MDEQVDESPRREAGQRPNILLLCTDQQRWDALGAAGNPHIDTPHLDRLAAEGARLTQCYVQSPVCGPSRASLMTGRYPRNHGEWANGVDLPADQELFTRALADVGYDCGLVGKLHLGAAAGGRVEPRLDDGFSTFRWAHDPYVSSSQNAYHGWLEQHFPGVLARTLAQGPAAFDTLPTEAHYSHWVAEEALGFLRRERGQPFCLVANFFDPHHGFGSPPEYRARYCAETLPPPSTVPDELADKPAVWTEASRRSSAGRARGFAEHSAEEIQEIKAQYYAMVSLVDDEVGRVLDALDELGLREDTVVVFTSDHGELLGDHQMLLKGPMMFDCSVRVPLLVRWPDRVAAGTVREDLVQWIDLAPTLLEAAGLPEALPRGQGRSLLPLLVGDPSWCPRGWALSEYRDSGAPYDPPVHTTMLRHASTKLVVHHGPPATSRPRDGELYDLAADPGELTNLWRDPGSAGLRLEMLERLLDVLVATEDRSNPRLAAF